MQHHLNSLVTERETVRVRLRFSDVVETEFRRLHAEGNYGRIRTILITAAALILVSLIVGVVENSLSWPTAAYMLGITLPALMATLVCTYKEGAHAAYQTLLALTAFLLGLMCTSVVIRGSMHGAPYYFAAQVAYIFLVWLVLGLRFSQAAVTALTLSLIYGWGMLRWDFVPREAAFSGLTLLAVNIIGAYCCYQLESALRQAFLESQRLNALAGRDGLTSLYNRRRFDEHIESLWRKSRRDQDQLALVMVDIDHFKPFNDFYGHQAGDDALKRVAEVIAEVTAQVAQRPLDSAARYGGEEFALVLDNPDLDHVRAAAEQLRAGVEELRIPHAASSTCSWLTVSVGVAIVIPGGERSLAGAIQLADEALYQAKEEGRNRVVVKESRSAHIQTGRFRASRYQATG